MSQDQAEQNIQMWKVKKLIKSLDAARGCARYGFSFLIWFLANKPHYQRWHFHDQFDYTPEGTRDCVQMFSAKITYVYSRIKSRAHPLC